MFEDKSIAVLIPCMNEALTISQVIKGFQTSLPKAAIYVYDNNSTDDTAKVAEKAGECGSPHVFGNRCLYVHGDGFCPGAGHVALFLGRGA